MRTLRRLLLAAALTAAAVPANLFAAEGGYSNYLPGTYGDFAMAVEPADRWTLRNDLYFYDADTDRSVRSGRLELGTELDFLMNLTTLLYKPGAELFGARYAAGIFVPLVDLELETSVSVGDSTLRVDDSASGLGDVALIPIALFWNRDKIHTSFVQLVVTPTGSYDVDNSINRGLNYWSFDTNFALTFLDPEKGRDLSFNVGHIYNTENDDTDYRTGQELHLDVALNQSSRRASRLGIHGFWLRQITGDSGDGALLGDFEAEAAGAGPALFWGTELGGRSFSFIAKWLHEFHADNRLEGDHIFLSFAVGW